MNDDWMEQSFEASPDPPKPVDPHWLYEFNEKMAALTGKSMEEILESQADPFLSNIAKNRGQFVVLAAKLTGIPTRVGKARPPGSPEKYVGVYRDYDLSEGLIDTGPFWKKLDELCAQAGIFQPDWKTLGPQALLKSTMELAREVAEQGEIPWFCDQCSTLVPHEEAVHFGEGLFCSRKCRDERES